MANTPQAKKRIRRNERRAAINGARISRIRTLVKKVEAAILAGDKDAAVAEEKFRSSIARRGISSATVNSRGAS